MPAVRELSDINDLLQLTIPQQAQTIELIRGHIYIRKADIANPFC